MKFLHIFLFLGISLFASEYYAKLEPINSYVVKSSVSGEVIYTNDDIEGKIAKNAIIVKIDDKVNKIDLKASEAKLDIIKQMIDIEQKNYNRLKKISTKSAFEKDAQKVKVLNLKSQKEDLASKIETLRDTLENKSLKEDGTFIYLINVKKGDYVNPGTVLYEAKDLSRAKLEIFVPINDANSLISKEIYIDGKKSSYKINKLYNVADSKHISSYKCEIIVDAPENFSKLVKIEFR